MSADAAHIRQILAVDRLLTREQKAALGRAIALLETEDRREDITRETPVTPERPR